MFIPEGPGISVEDIEKIQQEMREWEAAESEVIAESHQDRPGPPSPPRPSRPTA